MPRLLFEGRLDFGIRCRLIDCPAPVVLELCRFHVGAKVAVCRRLRGLAVYSRDHDRSGLVDLLLMYHAVICLFCGRRGARDWVVIVNGLDLYDITLVEIRKVLCSTVVTNLAAVYCLDYLDVVCNRVCAMRWPCSVTAGDMRMRSP